MRRELRSMLRFIDRSLHIHAFVIVDRVVGMHAFGMMRGQHALCRTVPGRRFRVRPLIVSSLVTDADLIVTASRLAARSGKPDSECAEAGYRR